ncbi:MAG: hypothetical protein HYV07_12535 [Deltaproteobacteria bacterium]|nr:hypothetical protein [Deltaproteobacteria bacterium]
MSLVATTILTLGVAASVPLDYVSSATATWSRADSAADSLPPRADAIRLVVLDLAAEGSLAAVSPRLTEQLIESLARRNELRVVGKAELSSLLQHAKDSGDVGVCAFEPDCPPKRGVPESEWVLSGRLWKLGESYSVALTLWHHPRASSVRTQVGTAQTLEELTQVTLDAAERLVGPPSKVHGDSASNLEPAKMNVAVLDLAAYEVSPELAENLTQVLAIELRRHDSMSVISRDEIRTMLAYEADKQIVQCTNDVACLVEIGGALGVEHLATGAVGILGDSWIIHLKLIDVTTAEVSHRVSETFRGPERQLAQALRFAVANLLGRPLSGLGSAWVLVDAEDASVAIDGGAPSPLVPPLRVELPAGKHALSFRATDLASIDQDFYVEPNEVTSVRLEPVALERAWYSTWWAWAAVGSALAVGVTITAVVAAQPPGTGTVLVSLPPRDE